jgi:AraC-like DNA-binding protein
VLIKKGKGIRLVGDHIERFMDNDLVFLGSYLPHEWRCDDSYYTPDGEFLGECIVIQFLKDSFGKGFFELPENKDLNKFLSIATQGCRIYGDTKRTIMSHMEDMLNSEEVERFYTLFSIFSILSSIEDYKLLSSPAFHIPYKTEDNDPMKNVIQFIHQNFQKEIKVNELQEISNMSNTTFFTSFKKRYRMTFKKYLQHIRIGYACRLLLDGSFNISQIGYESGFNNLSNFNRHFKAIKGCTPKEYKKHHDAQRSFVM